MSRSYRRPFAAITGVASAKRDKQLAHRGVRRKHNLALKACLDYESLLLPHAFECSWNNTYCWGRDGTQTYRGNLRNSAEDTDRVFYCKMVRK
jgi:hypothetical protein